MIKLADYNACTGCTACKAICPKDAITMVADEEGFLRPAISRDNCIECHSCEKVCPIFSPNEKDQNPLCYAAKNINDNIRLKSSSGGLFYIFACYILDQGGVVFGCILEEITLKAIHVKAENNNDLSKMHGSKYVQSDLLDTFREVKKNLGEGRRVLFTGTPCQIAGLKNFIGDNDENLFLVEIICYGVPSPKVFEKNKNEIETFYKKKLSGIRFREKVNSWRQCHISYEFCDGSKKKDILSNDIYIKTFFANLSLRPSCFQCVAVEGRSGADVTMGDFWGIEKKCPSINDDKGVSALLIHTEKGRKIWNSVSSLVDAVSVDYEDILAGNPYYINSVKEPKGRKKFLRLLENEDLEKVFIVCVYGPWYKRVLRYMYRRVNEILRCVKRSKR